MLTHMWFGGGFRTLGQMRLWVHVDGEHAPSIDMALYLGKVGFDPQPTTCWTYTRTYEW